MKTNIKVSPFSSDTEDRRQPKRPRTRPSTDLGGANMDDRQQSEDYESDSDNSGPRIGTQNKASETIETGHSRSDICHSWLGTKTNWPKEVEAFVRQFMIDHHYFHYRGSQKANKDVFSKLFKEVRGRAYKEGWTGEDDQRLAKKLRRKVDSVRSCLVKEGILKAIPGKDCVLVERDLVIGAADENMQSLIQTISTLSDKDALLAARTAIVRVDNVWAIMEILLSTMPKDLIK